MTNIKVSTEGDEVVVRINKNEDHGPSKSGKTTIVATTSGAIDVGDGIKLNINCYKNK